MLRQAEALMVRKDVNDTEKRSEEVTRIADN